MKHFVVTSLLLLVLVPSISYGLHEEHIYENLPDLSEGLFEKCRTSFPFFFQSIPSSEHHYSASHHANNNAGSSEESIYLAPTPLHTPPALDFTPEDPYYAEFDDEDPELTLAGGYREPPMPRTTVYIDTTGKVRRRNPFHKVKKTLKKIAEKHKEHKEAKQLRKSAAQFQPRPLPHLPMDDDDHKYEEIN